MIPLALRPMKNGNLNKAFKNHKVRVFLLTLFLGPFGLFYSNLTAATVMSLVMLIVGILTFGIGTIILALVFWPTSILVGYFSVKHYNNKLALENIRSRKELPDWVSLPKK